MVRVAKCPQCEHDLLIPDNAAASGLAKCPECKSFFELENAESRELPPVVLVDTKRTPELPVSHAPAPTEADEKSHGTWSTLIPALSEHEEPAASLDDEPLELVEHDSDETPEAAAQRIDQWFRSAKTLSDLPLATVAPAAEPEVQMIEPAPAADVNKTVDISAGGFDSDFELEQSAETPHEAAPWDDSQNMDRLLAGIESEPLPAFEQSDEKAAPIAREDPVDHEEHSHATEDWTPDASIAVTPGRGETRRKRSIVRTLVGTVVGGAVGLALAYYVLLWIRGPKADMLDLAKYLPKAVLPASFGSEAKKSSVNPSPSMIQDVVAAGKDDEQSPKATEAPPEKQAAFTTPVEPAKANAPSDDRYATPPAKTESTATTEPPAHEPAILTAPPAKPIVENTKPSEPIQIANAPSFTVEQLTESLQAAKDARAGLVDKNFSDGTEVKRIKGKSYATMADLAFKATFVDPTASPDNIAKMSPQVEKLFRETLLNAHTREEVGQIVPMWIASPNRKHGGVFFAGSVTHQGAKGTVVECSVDVGGGQTLIVLVPPAAVEKISGSLRAVGVVGWIVDKPAEQIKGYAGSASQAVFAKELISLE